MLEQGGVAVQVACQCVREVRRYGVVCAGTGSPAEKHYHGPAAFANLEQPALKEHPVTRCRFLASLSTLKLSPHLVGSGALPCDPVPVPHPESQSLPTALPIFLPVGPALPHPAGSPGGSLPLTAEA